MLRSSIRALTLAVAAAHAGSRPAPALAQLAEQPIRIVFPFAAGGSGDALARLIAEHLRTALKQPVIVENRTGAQGRLGVQAVKAAAPDGNTILLTPVAPMSVYQHVYKALAYDPVADFAPVSQVATFDFAVAVGPAGAGGEPQGAGGLGEGQPGPRQLRHARPPARCRTSSRCPSPRPRASTCATSAIAARRRRSPI